MCFYGKKKLSSFKQPLKSNIKGPVGKNISTNP